MKSDEMRLPIYRLLDGVLTPKQLEKTKIVCTYSDVFITWCFAHSSILEMNLKIRCALKQFAKQHGRTLRIRFERENPY